MKPVAIPKSETTIMRSPHTGRTYSIRYAEPIGNPDEHGFHVIYLLDGHRSFGTLVESVRTRCHRPETTGIFPAVVVGISHHSEDEADRQADYTAVPSGDSGQHAGSGAGATGFLSFIEDELKPWVASRVGIDPTRQVLFGHSLGAYFVLHTLVTRPDTFQAYVAASPSIWWNRDALIDGVAGLSHWRHAGVRVMITVGEREQPQPGRPVNISGLSDRHRQRRMVDNAREFATRLHDLANPNLDVEFHEFPDEDHASVVPLTINKSLRFVMARP